MRDVVALWYVGQGSAADIVYAACDLLAAGVDGPALRELAAVSIAAADIEVPELLESALNDVGLEYHVKTSAEANHAGLVAMASQALSGAITPRHLTQFAYKTTTSYLALADETADLASSLTSLECDYDVAEATGNTDTSEIDALVIAEARWIARAVTP
jgi:hypothetical protein